jgi:putative phosphoserine phosphatase/1-acylglycerol-3-phosphate O-acyltransferase
VSAAAAGPAPQAARVGAFFDMDYTLLAGSSGLLYLRWVRRRGYLSARQWARVTRWVAQYLLGITDFPHMMARLTVLAAGEGEEAAWDMTREWFETTLKAYIAPKARERVNWHRQQGHHAVIVSAATPYVVRHVARELQLDDAYLCTRLEVVNGRFTGNLVEPACYGGGKVVQAKTYAAAHGIDLARSYFYSDSASDLPLMEAVAYPVAVNPSRGLLRLAGQRGWPVMRFY